MPHVIRTVTLLCSETGTSELANLYYNVVTIVFELFSCLNFSVTHKFGRLCQWCKYHRKNNQKQKINHKWSFQGTKNSSLTTDGDGISTCISKNGASSLLFFRLYDTKRASSLWYYNHVCSSPAGAIAVCNPGFCTVKYLCW